MRTRRAFKAMLAWDAEAGKVNFEFAPSKFPPRPTAAAKKIATKSITTGPQALKPIKAKAPAAAKKTAKPAAKGTKTGTKMPRKAAAPKSAAAGLTPSAALAAVIGGEVVGRPQVIKKLWGYIKANQLQDSANKRAINADAKLLAVFGKPQVTMFELAGIVGKHLA
jgi:DNA topoisomerase-3